MALLRKLQVGVPLWVLSTTVFAAPCAGFADVDDASPFCTTIAWMKNRGITLGCGDGSTYCPGDFVRCDQMAAIIYRLGFQNAFLRGDNSFGATAVLGTQDDFALYLRASNRTVMRYLPNAMSPNILALTRETTSRMAHTARPLEAAVPWRTAGTTTRRPIE